jgi:hypothetical protein
MASVTSVNKFGIFSTEDIEKRNEEGRKLCLDKTTEIAFLLEPGEPLNERQTQDLTVIAPFVNKWLVSEDFLELNRLQKHQFLINATFLQQQIKLIPASIWSSISSFWKNPVEVNLGAVSVAYTKILIPADKLSSAQERADFLKETDAILKLKENGRPLYKSTYYLFCKQFTELVEISLQDEGYHKENFKHYYSVLTSAVSVHAEDSKRPFSAHIASLRISVVFQLFQYASEIDAKEKSLANKTIVAVLCTRLQSMVEFFGDKAVKIAKLLHQKGYDIFLKSNQHIVLLKAIAKICPEEIHEEDDDVHSERMSFLEALLCGVEKDSHVDWDFLERQGCSVPKYSSMARTLEKILVLLDKAETMKAHDAILRCFIETRFSHHYLYKLMKEGMRDNEPFFVRMIAFMRRTPEYKDSSILRSTEEFVKKHSKAIGT